jgi:peptidoglycan hydrolase-like protein with peptidoglycan-binding domain
VPTNGGYSGRLVNVVMADREKTGRIYATTTNTTTGGGFFFISNDGGATWQPSMRNMSNRLITYSILQDERDANVLYLGTNLGVYRSLDRGASWTAIGAPKIEAPAPKGKKSRRAKATTATAASGAATRSNDMTKRGQEALNAAGYNVGVPDGKAGTGTVTQLRKFQADKGIPVSGRFDDATLNALGLGGGVVETNDRGKLPVPVVALTDTVNALVATHDERDGRIGMLAATNAGLYRTYDPTRGWEKLNYGAGFDPRTTCLSTSAQNPQTIWVGTATSGVLVSRDAGQTWQQARDIPPNSPISAIAQDMQRSAYIYVGTKQTLYVSHDGGERWMRRGGNLPYGDYASILINPENGNEIFVGNAWEQGGGVFRSVNAGDTWLRIDPRDARLPSQRIWALAFASHDQNRLFVGSHSAGVYVADRSGGTAFNTEK